MLVHNNMILHVDLRSFDHSKFWIMYALAWDVTVPDTYADSHLADTATTAGAAADKAASNKEAKYSSWPTATSSFQLP